MCNNVSLVWQVRSPASLGNVLPPIGSLLPGLRISSSVCAAYTSLRTHETLCRVLELILSTDFFRILISQFQPLCHPPKSEFCFLYQNSNSGEVVTVWAPLFYAIIRNVLQTEMWKSSQLLLLFPSGLILYFLLPSA